MLERYPQNIKVGPEDFRKSRWRLALGNADRDGYWSMSQALSASAKQAMDDGDLAEGKVLWLLADACSMMLQPSGLNEPFKPFIAIGGKRSALPEDFEHSDVDLFSQIVEEIDDVWLRARISDLVWLLLRPREPKFALLAIDAYRLIPIDAETWLRDGRECWERALGLTLVLRGGAGDRLKKIEEVLITTLENTTSDDGFLCFDLASLISDNRLGQTKQIDIARHLEALASDFASQGDLHQAREYFDAAAVWFRKAGEETKATEMIVQVAEGWVKEAFARTPTEPPSHMVAAVLLETAIHKYRSIPRAQRAVHTVDERIAEIRKVMNAAGEKAIEEMGAITTSPIDISELVEHSRNAVRGKSITDALAAFANISRGVRVDQIRKFAEKMLSEHPLQSLFSATHRSRDGRVIARRPGINLSDPDANENESAIWAEMIRHYGMGLGITVQGVIWPALEVLRLEHRIREADFIAISRQSPIVPHGRERLFGKALFAGYENDFACALHLLIPQIEHLIRWHLNANGVKTTTIDSNGIENENGLSTLVDAPELKQIFGADFAFEIKALFCDAFGPNLRNELAHGLLGDEECESIYSIYAWWLGLRIVFNTLLNARQKKSEPDAPVTDA